MFREVRSLSHEAPAFNTRKEYYNKTSMLAHMTAKVHDLGEELYANQKIIRVVQPSLQTQGREKEMFTQLQMKGEMVT